MIKQQKEQIIEKMIREGRDYLEEDDLDGFYAYLDNHYPHQNIRLITEYFYFDCGVNPLEYMKSVPHLFLYNSLKLSSIEIPYNIEEIGEEAFECSTLENITFSDNSRLKKIGDLSFYETNIEHIIIPEGVTIIGEGAFENCGNLEGVRLPDTLEIIDAEAFMNCEGLFDINIPKNLKSVHYSAFDNCYKPIYEKFRKFVL